VKKWERKTKAVVKEVTFDNFAFCHMFYYKMKLTGTKEQQLILKTAKCKVKVHIVCHIINVTTIHMYRCIVQHEPVQE
jgi:hypothetical protein